MGLGDEIVEEIGPKAQDAVTMEGSTTATPTAATMMIPVSPVVAGEV
jgi:hypothetical protein